MKTGTYDSLFPGEALPQDEKIVLIVDGLMCSFLMQSGAAFLTEIKKNPLLRIFSQMASSVYSEVQNTDFSSLEEFELEWDPPAHQSKLKLHNPLFG